jgi:hypothetical protein
MRTTDKSASTRTMPPINSLKCTASAIKRRLMKNLYGKVFHVTNAEGFTGIINRGKIIPSKSGLLSENWGGSGFFRNRGCISVCDLVNNTSKIEISRAISKYYFFNLPCNKGETYLLFINNSLHNHLVSWEQWKKDEAFGETIVPHLESGYPGEVSIFDIDTILILNVKDHFKGCL